MGLGKICRFVKKFYIIGVKKFVGDKIFFFLFFVIFDDILLLFLCYFDL